MDHRIEKNQKCIPLTTLMVYILLMGSAYSNFFYDNWANDHFQCKRQPIMKSYQVWRVLTSCFNQPSLVGLAWVLLLTYGFLSKIERKNGTVVPFTNLLIYTMTFNIFMQSVLITVYLIYIYVLQKQFTFQIKTGILCIWLNVLYKFYYFNRNSSLTVLKMPVLAIPPIILMSVMLADWQIRIDAIFGLSFAVLECIYFRGGLISFTKETYSDKEYVADTIRLSKIWCWCKLHPEKLVMNELAVLSEHQFYEDLDPYIDAPFEEYNLDSQRINENENNQMIPDKSFEEIEDHE